MIRIRAIASLAPAAALLCLCWALAPTERNLKAAPAKAQKSTPTGRVPDFSGNWGPGPNGPMGGWDQNPLPMTSWGKAKYDAARPPFGPKATFENINDPVQLYCDPPGIPRIYPYPWEFTILQTKDVVYMLFEFTRTWRSIAINRDHPKDPDPTWLGDSVGHYEGGTLVVDTIGFNEKTWLDQTGYPHSSQLHLVERMRTSDPDTLEIAITADDPKAYTQKVTGKRLFKRTDSPMGETICSVSEMHSFQKEIMDPTTTKRPGK
jgi:hypothetical protein